MYFESKGAFTGEVSAEMLKDLGVKYVIIGHSERRQYFAETDATVNKKVHAALEVGLNPIICVGETLEQRELGITPEWIALQVKSALYGVPADKLRRCIVAYEPIWAIGTGKTATSDQAGEVCTGIRATIRALYGARVARSVTIQYGGSMRHSIQDGYAPARVASCAAHLPAILPKTAFSVKAVAPRRLAPWGCPR